MPNVYSFIAWSGTGKTTYLEGLIAALKAAHPYECCAYYLFPVEMPEEPAGKDD